MCMGHSTRTKSCADTSRYAWRDEADPRTCGTASNFRWFQRFAVWSHKLSQEIGEKGKDGSKLLDEQLSKFSEVAKEKTAQLRKEFEENLKKLQEADQQQRQRQMKR
eukprot:jgi/Chrzof1/4348/Cz14g09190.t1